MTARELHCGFLPLVDCASLVIAKEIGFATEENIDLVLHREPNWSLIRPMMAKAIENKEIDAFCVGEPWGSITVAQCDAQLVLPGSAIWALAPEKVLATRARWIAENYHKAGGLFRATWRAAKWMSKPDNLMTASEILSRPEYVNVPAQIIDRALTGRIETADLYREFIEPLGEDTPGASEKVEGLLTAATPVGSAKGKITLGPDHFFDGRSFDPDAS